MLMKDLYGSLPLCFHVFFFFALHNLKWIILLFRFKIAVVF